MVNIVAIGISRIDISRRDSISATMISAAQSAMPRTKTTIRFVLRLIEWFPRIR